MEAMALVAPAAGARAEAAQAGAAKAAPAEVAKEVLEGAPEAEDEVAAQGTPARL